jgi:CMP-N,N'-diacetyllegionaminic acid synthase
MKKRIIAMIPARVGSQRLKLKNLVIINGKPLVYYAIEAAKKSKIFDKIVLNSDSDLFRPISKKYNIDFYLRPKWIGNSQIKSDDVINDFIEKYPNFEILAWVNPIAPLQDGHDLKKIVGYFLKKKLDSLITTEKKQIHARYKNKSINFSKNGKFKKTQDLHPIELFSYTVMMWRIKKFKKKYEKYKSGIFCGKFSTFSLDSYKSLIVKTIFDLKLIEKVMQMKNFKLKARYEKIYYKK